MLPVLTMVTGAIFHTILPLLVNYVVTCMIGVLVYFCRGKCTEVYHVTTVTPLRHPLYVALSCLSLILIVLVL